MKIENSVALVTGASSGIGAAAAQALAELGAQVILLARTLSALEMAAGKIRSGGGSAHIYAVDLTDAAAVENIHRRIVSEVGHPEILINSAGAGRWLFTEETDPAEMVQMMAAPYFCAFYVTRLCLPEMVRRGRGHIVNINSPAAFSAWPGATAYTAARYALYGFTKALQMDLRGTGINVTAMIPGQTQTEYFEHNAGVMGRIPRIGLWLIPPLTAGQVAAATMRAIEQNRREVIMPFMLWLIAGLNHFSPWLVERLIWQTGYRHDRLGAKRN